MSLAPDPLIQKILISSTSRFVGDFSRPWMRIDHAWPNMRARANYTRFDQGPISRSAYVVTFRTPPTDEKLIINSYGWTGDIICACLAVLFGKRFDNHGALEASGYFNLPDLNAYSLMCDHLLPQHTHKPRPDFGFELNLREVRRVLPVLRAESGGPDANAFRTGAKFYLQALQAAEHDMEVAYLHLITAGEIISGSIKQDAASLLDEPVKKVLEQIERDLPGGKKASRVLRGRMLSVKRRFVGAFDALIDPGFFRVSEAEHSFERLKPETFSKVMGAAYDLRSKYVHTGRSFGSWVAPHGLEGAEIHHGHPVIDDDPAFAKLLYVAPTYIGLERVVRYALLRLGQRCGIDLEPAPPEEAEAAPTE